MPARPGSRSTSACGRSRTRPARSPHDRGGWVGVDRGLTDLLVAAGADGIEAARIPAPKTLATRLGTLRRLSRRLSRTQKGSNNRREAIARLARTHAHIRAARQHALHQVSNQLVNTHDRLALEDLNVAVMLRNHRDARRGTSAGRGNRRGETGPDDAGTSPSAAPAA